ncbi:TetR family transcriptional regulator [Vibrio sp. JC009]|uniref:TetR/AcrR family transcriptional regulator n=1 Tax=Vibrio sp. JC009 TaxID=2912314 RepID=UPI0023B1B055|nr:TetR family transcriptional regulator [Vibrio sp. JC009]WED24689.1 TetR family transcriptional regulator [Vibrio sp. JC009]
MKNTTKQRVGRPARISQNDVSQAALDIGLDKVTVKAIGQHLGVDHSSLYRHVKSRNDILYAATDSAFLSIKSPQQTDHWRLYIEAIADQVWELYERYPGLADLVRTMDRIPSSAIRLFSSTCLVLETHGFSKQDSVLIVDSVFDMTSEASVGWKRLTQPNRNGGNIGESRMMSWNDVAEEHEETAIHVEIFNQIMKGGAKNWWWKKLSLVLDGAELKLKNTVV